jgi:putative membrane protein
VLLAATFWTPIHHLGLHYLLTAHLLQNVVLAEWAPLLAAYGIPPAASAAFARSRLWRFATRPVVALPVWLLSYYAWHVPYVYDGALHHQSSLVHVEHACYFATGFLMWWPLVQELPHHLSSGARAAYGFAAFVLAAPLGLLLALLPRAIYGYYVHARPRVWGLSPLADQELAGATMAAEQAVVLFVVCFYWFGRFLNEEGAV